MAHLVMLDTNIVSDFVRNPRGPANRKLRKLPGGSACISVITAGELKYGLLKKASVPLRQKVEALLAVIDIVPFAEPADHSYARIRDALTRAGSLIGPVDLFIAAHALALDLTLITANIREFSRVPGLRVENWLD